MTTSMHKTFVIAISVIVVLFLLFDGGSMSATSVAGDLAITNRLGAHSWIWIVPTLMIFGLGFLLAWIIIGKDEVTPQARDVRSHAAKERALQGNACNWERLDDSSRQL